jgi:uncharacterized protein (TIGR03083 family)
MSEAGIRGMRAAGDDLLEVASTLTDTQWQTPSAATGWSVKDVVIHIGALLELLQGAVTGAEVPPVGIEKLNDEVVDSRRDWTAKQTQAVLRDQLDAAVEAFSPLQSEPIASTVVPMLDLGSYPLHAVADMFSFDIATHLRYDILRPRGPIPSSLPALDDTQLVPAVSWLIGGLPQMQPGLGQFLLAPITLQLNGSGGRDVVLSSEAGVLSAGDPADAAVVTTVTSTAADFLAWSTQRLPWPAVVHVDGDEQVARQFLNALNLV